MFINSFHKSDKHVKNKKKKKKKKKRPDADALDFSVQFKCNLRFKRIYRLEPAGWIRLSEMRWSL